MRNITKFEQKFIAELLLNKWLCLYGLKNANKISLELRRLIIGRTKKWKQGNHIENGKKNIAITT